VISSEIMQAVGRGRTQSC